MKSTMTWQIWAFVVMAFLAFAAPVKADIQDILDPNPEGLRAGAGYSYLELPKADFGQGLGTFSSATDTYSLRARRTSKPKQALTASLNYQQQDNYTQALMPDTGAPFPKRLYRLGLESRYYKQIANGYTVAFGMGLRMAGDDMDLGESLVMAQIHGTVLVPVKNSKNAWIFALYAHNHYSESGSLLVPGVGYWYQPSDKFNMLIGLPIIRITWRPDQKTTLNFTSSLVRGLDSLFDARASRLLAKNLTGYAGFKAVNSGYNLVDPGAPDFKFYSQEKRLFAGANVTFFKRLRLGLEAGYSFDRVFFEGPNLREDTFNRMTLDPAVYGLVSLNLSI